MILKGLFHRKKTIATLGAIVIFIGILFAAIHIYAVWQRNALRTTIEQFTIERTKRAEPQQLPPIAVVMTTYNRADLLSRAIDSVLKQTKTDFHFIIVDDGSTDDTLALLYDYMQKDNRIRVYPNKKNQGISAGRNKLLDLTPEYQYIANLDSDDYVFPQWLEKGYEHMRNNPETVVVVGQSVTTRSPKELSPRWSQNNQTFAEYILRKSPIPHSGSILQRTFLKKHKLKYDTEMIAGEDYDIWMRILSIGGSRLFSILFEPLFACRDHATNSAHYYKEIANTHTNIRRRFYQQFYSSDENDFDDPKCDKIKHIRNTEKGKNLFTPEQWDYAITTWCPQDNQEVFGYFIMETDTDDWEDYLIKLNVPNKVYRLRTLETMTVLSQSDNRIVLENKARGRMVFSRKLNSPSWIINDN